MSRTYKTCLLLHIPINLLEICAKLSKRRYEPSLLKEFYGWRISVIFYGDRTLRSTKKDRALPRLRYFELDYPFALGSRQREPYRSGILLIRALF